MKNTDPRKWRPNDPRRLRMAQKRTEILRAARPVLLRDGLGGTTLDRVAAEGRISKMTLYRHFASKEALFEGLVTDMCEQMREGIENAPSADAHESAPKRLGDELRAFTAALIQPDWLALYRLLVADGWRFPHLARTFDESGMRIIRRRIAALLESGAVPADESGQLAGEVIALALGDAYQRAVLGISADGGGGEAFAQQTAFAKQAAVTEKDEFAPQIESAVTHGFRRSTRR